MRCGGASRAASVRKHGVVKATQRSHIHGDHKHPDTDKSAWRCEASPWGWSATQVIALCLCRRFSYFPFLIAFREDNRVGVEVGAKAPPPRSPMEHLMLVTASVVVRQVNFDAAFTGKHFGDKRVLLTA